MMGIIDIFFIKKGKKIKSVELEFGDFNF
jgi:hypothetical protein